MRVAPTNVGRAVERFYDSDCDSPKRDCKPLSFLLSVNLASRLLYVRRVRVFEGHL